MPKNVVILIRSCPYGIATAGEAYRIASGLAAMDHKVNIIFIEDGVFTGFGNQKPEIIEMQNVSLAYKGISEFGAETYFCEECMTERKIKSEDLSFGQIIKILEIKKFIDNSDVVMSFS